MNRGWRKRQRGAITVMAAVLLLVLVSYAVLVALDQAGSNASNATMQDHAVQALLLADSGLERALQRYKSGTACTSLAPDGPHTLGNGTFDIAAAVVDGSQCRVTVIGARGEATQKLVERLSPPAAVEIVSDAFPSAADFAVNWGMEVLSKTAGSSGWSSDNCSGAVCPAASGGSFFAQTNVSGRGDQFKGYRERPIPLLNTGNGVNVRVTLVFRKDAVGGSATKQGLTVTLVDSSHSRTVNVWSDTQVITGGAWTAVDQIVALPSGFSYDKIQLTYDLQEWKWDPVYVWVDELTLRIAN